MTIKEKEHCYICTSEKVIDLSKTVINGVEIDVKYFKGVIKISGKKARDKMKIRGNYCIFCGRKIKGE